MSHHNDELPRLLIGGTSVYERDFNDFYKVGFRQCARCFFFQTANQDGLVGDVIYYRPGPGAFERILGLLPPGWEPDYVLMMVSDFHDIPAGIEHSPYTTVQFFDSETVKSLKIGQDLGFFDVFAPGCTETIPHALAWGGQYYLPYPEAGFGLFDSYRDQGLARDIDVIYLGTLDRGHYFREYRRRDKIIRLVNTLPAQHRVLLSVGAVVDYLATALGPVNLGVSAGTMKLDNGQHGGPQYLHALNRARIGLCITEGWSGLHTMLFEMMGNGVLTFIPDDNLYAKEKFQDRVEAVYFNESNLLELLEYYLTHEDERAEIARRGYDKVHHEYHCFRQVLPSIKPALDAAGLRHVRHRPMAHAPADQVLMAHGRSYFHNGQYQLALDNFEAVRAQPGPYQAEAMNNAAVVLITAQGETITPEQTQYSLQLLEQANSLSPDNVIVRFNFLLARLKFKPETVAADLAATGWLRQGDYTLKPEDQDGLIINTKPYSYFQVELAYARVSHYQLDEAYRRRVTELLAWQTWYQLGEHALRYGKRHAALAAYLQALPFNPDDYFILAKLGELYLALNCPAAAIPYLLRALEVRPFAKDVAQRLAQAYALGRQQAELEHVYRDIIKNNPFASKEECVWFENLIDSTQKAMAAGPATPLALALVVNTANTPPEQVSACLAQLERYQSTSAKLTRLVIKTEANRPTETAPAESPLELAWRVAVAAQSEYIALLSPDVNFSHHWLDNLVAVLKSEAAIAAVGPVANNAPAPQRVEPGYKNVKNDMLKFADKRWRNHLYTWAEAPYLGGFCVVFKSEAVQHVGGLPSAPDFATALWGLYHRLLAAGYKLARANGVYVHHQQLTADEGEQFDAWAKAALLAELHRQTQAAQLQADWPLAVELLEKTLAQGLPAAEAASAWNGLGYCRFMLGHAAAAETAFLKGLELAPADFDLLGNLAELYLQQERYDLGTRYLNRVLKIDPNHVNTLLSLGNCCIQLGKFEAALMAFRRVGALAPETEGIQPVIMQLETMVKNGA